MVPAKVDLSKPWSDRHPWFNCVELHHHTARSEWVHPNPYPLSSGDLRWRPRSLPRPRYLSLSLWTYGDISLYLWLSLWLMLHWWSLNDWVWWVLLWILLWILCMWVGCCVWILLGGCCEFVIEFFFLVFIDRLTRPTDRPIRPTLWTVNRLSLWKPDSVK